MWTEWDDDFDAFYDAYLRDQEQYGGNHGILAKAGQLPPPNAYTVSCVPWISFQHFAVHSYDKPYFLPSVETGRFYERDGRIWFPLSVACHHATTDGWHVSRFLERFKEEADAWN